MRVVLFAEESSQGLAGPLEAEGISLDRQELPHAHGPEAGAALVGGFRDASDSLADDPPEAVLVAGTDDVALAAVLTAVKLQVPTAWLRDPESPADPLVARVADETLDATAPAGDLAAQVRALAARRIPAP